ncbi:hypothetical protein ABW19_dt0200112 [Dactylella cylindrospora]|nr:hypothetical protein ABW19_dt0200112 [Dactylella cylindrospora]
MPLNIPPPSQAPITNPTTPNLPQNPEPPSYSLSSWLSSPQSTDYWTHLREKPADGRVTLPDLRGLEADTKPKV